MESAKQNRIQQLEKYLEKDPKEAFSNYALALELVDIDDVKAEKLFDYLLNEHPDYTATYYHAAAFQTELGNVEKAQEIYENGLKVLKTTNEAKALQELQNAYQNFLFEEDF
ncbi:MAG: tetratricopeptide repeat protein [Cytophagales bacterium]|nr:tetratricopeptide repeat protein [Cytophagales bacterium]